MHTCTAQQKCTIYLTFTGKQTTEQRQVQLYLAGIIFEGMIFMEILFRESAFKFNVLFLHDMTVNFANLNFANSVVVAKLYNTREKQYQ